MTETLPRSENEILRVVKMGFENRRVEALESSGFGSWFSHIEAQVQQGLIPDLTTQEGDLCAKRFTSLKELKPSQPIKTTETPIMEAITIDLKEVFGDSVEEEIESLVVNKLMPLRGVEIGPETESNEYLVIAVKNVLRDVVAMARVFQMTDQEIKDLYPEVEPDKMRQASLQNLSLSLLTRGLKGQTRAAGLCTRAMHQEHIWMIRGVRDVPSGGFQEIGKFIDEKLSS